MGCLLLLTGQASQAAMLTVTGGQATFNYHESAFTPGVYQALAFFDKSSNDLTYSQLVSVNIDADAGTQTWDLPGDVRAWTGLVSEFNESTVTSPTQRYLQATNFTYDPTDIVGTASGQIGLGGVARLEINYAVSSGSLFFGDLGLFYSTTDSQWQLKSIIAGFESFPVTHFFRIENSTTTPTANGFTVTGDLYMTEELGGMVPSFYNVRMDGGQYVSVGNISVNVIAVPEPSTWALLGSGTLLLSFLRRRQAE